jgi:hypothetical protein
LLYLTQPSLRNHVGFSWRRPALFISKFYVCLHLGRADVIRERKVSSKQRVRVAVSNFRIGSCADRASTYISLKIVRGNTPCPSEGTTVSPWMHGGIGVSPNSRKRELPFAILRKQSRIHASITRRARYNNPAKIKLRPSSRAELCCLQIVDCSSQEGESRGRRSSSLKFSNASSVGLDCAGQCSSKCMPAHECFRP